MRMQDNKVLTSCAGHTAGAVKRVIGLSLADRRAFLTLFPVFSSTVVYGGGESVDILHF